MSDKSRPKHKPRKKDRAPRPAVDGLTVAWATTLVTVVVCEATALIIRLFIGFQSTSRLTLLSNYLLLTAALMGPVLIVLTPVVVRRGRSHPPLGVVIAAYLVGAAPWLVIALRSM
jgi:hypothetical protein